MLDRLTGWVFVGVSVMLVAAMIGRAVQGFSAGWWEWPVVAAMSALMLLVGVALLMDEPPDLLVFAVLAGYGVGLMAFGIFALVAPDAAVVTSGRGPRTPGAARILGVLLLVSGTGIAGGAAAVVLRRRRAG